MTRVTVTLNGLNLQRIDKTRVTCTRHGDKPIGDSLHVEIECVGVIAFRTRLDATAISQLALYGLILDCDLIM